MTVHSKITKKGVESKIILPQNPSTILLPKLANAVSQSEKFPRKKRKIIKSIEKIRKSTKHFYKKSKLYTILATLKIQNRSTNRYKVHSRCKHPFNKA